MSDGVAVAWSLSVASTASAFSKRLWESWRRLVAGAISKVLWEGCGKVPEHFSKRSGSPSIGPSDAAASTGHGSFLALRLRSLRLRSGSLLLLAAIARDGKLEDG